MISARLPLITLCFCVFLISGRNLAAGKTAEAPDIEDETEHKMVDAVKDTSESLNKMSNGIPVENSDREKAFHIEGISIEGEGERTEEKRESDEQDTGVTQFNTNKIKDDIEEKATDGRQPKRTVNLLLKLIMHQNYGPAKSFSAILVPQHSEKMQHLELIEEELNKLNKGVEKIWTKLLEMSLVGFLMLMVAASVTVIILAFRIVSKRKKFNLIMSQLQNEPKVYPIRRRAIQKKVKGSDAKKIAIKETKINMKEVDEMMNMTSSTARLPISPATPKIPVRPPRDPNSFIHQQHNLHSENGDTQDPKVDDISWASTQTTSPCSGPPAYTTLPPGQSPPGPLVAASDVCMVASATKSSSNTAVVIKSKMETVNVDDSDRDNCNIS